MAARFWVGGTGTWDASDTTHWASSSGGAGGQSVPGSSDTVTFDGSSGSGTVTVSHASNSISSLTMGAFTGTLDFATNDNNITMGSFNNNGTGTRTLNMGDGTWTLTGASGSIWQQATTTNLTFNANGSTIEASATPTGSRVMNLGAVTYNNIHINNAVAVGYEVGFDQAATISGTLTFTNHKVTRIVSAVNITVTGAITWNCSAAAPGVLHSGASAATLTVAATNTLTGIAVGAITKAGAGSITINDGYDLGNNSNITINAPSGGGGGSQRVYAGG